MFEIRLQDEEMQGNEESIQQETKEDEEHKVNVALLHNLQ